MGLSSRNQGFLFGMLVWALVSVNLSNADVFNAQIELETLFELAQSVSSAVSEYLKQEDVRLTRAREKYLSSTGLLQSVNYSNSKNATDFKLNPINAFLVIKSLALDLDEILQPALELSNIEGQHFTFL